jgi:hypothetical protein
MIVLGLSLSLLWYSIVDVHLSIVENNLFFYCSHLNMHTCVYLYTSGRHINFLLFKLHMSYCENLIFFFFKQYVSKATKNRERGREHGWTASLIEVTVDVSVLQLEIHHVFCSFFLLLFLVVNWRRVTVPHTITRKLQRPFSHEAQRHKINEMECVCVVFFLSFFFISTEFNIIIISFSPFLVFTEICELLLSTILFLLRIKCRSSGYTC